MHLKDKPEAIAFLHKLFTESVEFKQRFEAAHKVLKQEFPGMFPLRASRGHILQRLLPVKELAPDMQLFIQDEAGAGEPQGDDENIRLGSMEKLRTEASGHSTHLVERFGFLLKPEQQIFLVNMLTDLLCREKTDTASVKMQCAFDTESEEVVIRIKAPMTKGEAAQCIGEIEKLQEGFIAGWYSDNPIHHLEAQQRTHEEKLFVGRQKGKKGLTLKKTREKYLDVRNKRRHGVVPVYLEQEYQELRKFFQGKPVFQENKKGKRPWKLDDELELLRVKISSKSFNKREFAIFRKRRLASLLAPHNVQFPDNLINSLKDDFDAMSVGDYWKNVELSTNEKQYFEWLCALTLRDAQRHLESLKKKNF